MTEKAIGRVGQIDRLLRFALGAAVLAAVLFCPWFAAQGQSFQIGAGLVGAVLVGTAAIRVCPLYRILGVCTG